MKLDILLQKLHFIFHSGKNRKLPYYIRSYCRLAIPYCLSYKSPHKMLAEIDGRPDAGYIRERAEYYCNLQGITSLPATAPGVSEIADIKVKKPKVYPLDFLQYARCFNRHLKVPFLPGDITHVPEMPSIVKSRPIHGDNRNSVLMKLDAVRHFIFVNDRQKFSQKKSKAIYRGKSKGNPLRMAMHRLYQNHPMCDVGDVDRHGVVPEEWRTQKLTLPQQMEFKFIMALEGNDVASNLKWVMSSNSVAVMPEPKYETWFMEGKLKPDYHYIRVKPDLSDLPERIQHYIDHPDEAEAIIRNAHKWVDQFRDKRREFLISWLVLYIYFTRTGQIPQF